MVVDEAVSVALVEGEGKGGGGVVRDAVVLCAVSATTRVPVRDMELDPVSWVSVAKIFKFCRTNPYKQFISGRDFFFF